MELTPFNAPYPILSMHVCVCVCICMSKCFNPLIHSVHDYLVAHFPPTFFQLVQFNYCHMNN